MPPYISTRAYIQWLPDPPSEPTSTQVLTSSQKRFVDIRVAARKSLGGEDPAHVEWAFAGHSESKVVDGKTLSQWHHWIDSKATAPEEVVDQGEMLPEDADGLALEKGAMVNPATGRMTAYVEGWRDVEIRAATPLDWEIVSLFLQSLQVRGIFIDGLQATSTAGSRKLSLVLQHENVERRARGMVVRLGQICQGVMRVGDEFAYERWECASETDWCKTRDSGNLDMPCDLLTVLGEIMLPGTTVRYGEGDDRAWKCVEAEQL
jgi:hypothetical protein